MIDLFDVILAFENTYVFFEKDIHVFPETRTCFFGNNEKLPDRREKHPIMVAYLRKRLYFCNLKRVGLVVQRIE